MNIYLDIDGVLLVNEKYAALHAKEFLTAVLDRYPDNSYWLTTHCWQGINRTSDALAPVLDSYTIELIKKIKPTEWGQLKTDAINFSEPFLWFDDDLYEDERTVLKQHNVLKSRIEVNLYKDPEQLNKLVSLL